MRFLGHKFVRLQRILTLLVPLLCYNLLFRGTVYIIMVLRWSIWMISSYILIRCLLVFYVIFQVIRVFVIRAFVLKNICISRISYSVCYSGFIYGFIFFIFMYIYLMIVSISPLFLLLINILCY